MTKEEWYKQLFEHLEASKFRSSFHLKKKDIDYINEKGLDVIRQHAQDFIVKREAPAFIPNDGKQTPMRGHPVFIAQHTKQTFSKIKNSAAILTEGRKFGWSAWFATQSLKVLKEEEIVRLLQASFKLYFKPTDIEIGKIAKQIDVTGEGNWLGVIQGLQKGQCIVTGDRMLANGKVGASNPVVTNITAFEKRQ